MKILFSILIYLSLTSISIGQNSYSFFIAGHTSGAPGVNNTGLYPIFKNKFSYIQNRPEIKFGILAGDIVSTDPTIQDWEEVDTDIETLGIPIYFAVGNHDIENRPVFEDRYGDTYYSYTYENDLFIILDPNLDSWNISGDQLLFFQTTINNNASSVDNIFILFHQLLWIEDDNPYYDIRPNSKEGKADDLNFWTEIEPICHQLDNSVFFLAGDLGAGDWCIDFMYDSYDNVTLIASGMGEGVGDNFVVINISTDKSVSYDLICLNETETECFGELTDYNLHNSIELPLKNNQVFAFPNPAKSFITLKGYNPKENVQFNIYNSNGQIILRKNVIYQEKVNLSQLSSGVYFYQIQANKWIKNGKLIIIE